MTAHMFYELFSSFASGYLGMQILLGLYRGARWVLRQSFTGTIAGAKCWGILYDRTYGIYIGFGSRSWRP